MAAVNDPQKKKAWFALKCHAKREKQVLFYLEHLGITAYLPEIPIAVRKGSPVFEPLFPTYVFFELETTASLWPIVRWTPGSHHIVSYGNEPAIVPNEVIEFIRQRVGDGASAKSESLYRPGDTVLIARGPFAGLEAVFDQGIRGTQRARVFIHMLGRTVTTHVPTDQLRVRV